MSMCLLEVAMCKKNAEPAISNQSRGGGGGGGRVKSLRTGAEFSTGVENMVVVGGGALQNLMGWA